jgi:hypothetical protein
MLIEMQLNRASRCQRTLKCHFLSASSVANRRKIRNLTGVHAFCVTAFHMTKSNPSTANHLLGVVQLLEQIVTAFDDAYSRPQREIELYKKYLELSQRYNVKLAGRFIVITGGGGKKQSPTKHQKQRTMQTFKKPIVLNSATNAISSGVTTCFPEF